MVNPKKDVPVVWVVINFFVLFQVALFLLVFHYGIRDIITDVGITAVEIIVSFGLVNFGKILGKREVYSEIQDEIQKMR